MPRLVLTSALAVALGFPLAAADWPRFRGPNGAGVADPNTPTDVSRMPAWKVPIPGHGHSSPVVVGGRLFLQTASDDGGTRSLLCLDAATGDVKWTRDVAGSRGHTHKKSSLASGTPAVDGDRVYALFWDGQAVALHAYDLDGKPLWSAALGGFVSDHGAGMSPVAHGGKVFVVNDQGAKTGDGAPSEVVAFDGKTGEKKWAAARKAFRHCSASPVVRELPGGKAELVVATTPGLTGYDPDTGAVNWNWAWDWKGGMALRTVGSPLVVGGTVVAVSGDGGGSRSAVAVTPGAAPKLLWEKKKGTPYVPTPLAHGDHLYWVTDDGQAFCAGLKTGAVAWSERIFPKAVSASPILVGDRVLAVAEDGKVVAFKATPEKFEPTGGGALGEGVYATPAAAGGRLYVRGFDHLFCFAGK